MHGLNVVGRGHDLVLGHDPSDHHPSQNTVQAGRSLSWDEDPNLKVGPKVISSTDSPEYEPKWRASGGPSSYPHLWWGPDSWRGDKQRKHVHGTTRNVGMYKLLKFLDPSSGVMSAAALPQVKTPSSKLKVTTNVNGLVFL